MQRVTIILACFFICVNRCSAQQYPFVHYTPKDGLISNVIRSIYQDSKGRLYFASVHGLSVYDGSRFTNYNSKNGLSFDVVNCIMEMGNDSVWIVTNTKSINCLVNGKLKLLPLKKMDFIINNMCKDEKGNLYGAAEEGLCMFDKDQFIKLPLVDLNGKDINSYLSYVFSVGDYLLIQRDNSMFPGPADVLYLYNKITNKVTAELSNLNTVQIAPDGRIWAGTQDHIKAIDTVLLKKGELVLQDLPAKYEQIKNLGKFLIYFDAGNNCWLGNQSNLLIKASPNGSVTAFTPGSGINMFTISFIMQDREAITWIASINDGVTKLVHSNFSYIEEPFGIRHPSDISYNATTGNLLIYSSSTHIAAIIHDNEKKYFHFKDSVSLTRLIESPYGFFGIGRNSIYKLDQKNGMLYPTKILSDSPDNVYPNFIIDKNGNLLVSGKYHLSAVINGKKIYKISVPFFADVPVSDSKGNIWLATRSNDLLMYQTHPEDPSHYLEQKLYFKKELEGISPRSIIIDKYDNIWVGTRNHGIHVFSLINGKLIKKYIIIPASGLSDEFTTHLSCDTENVIWVSSVSGLDKIIVRNGTPLVENITRQNNIYQSLFKVAIDKNKTVWGLGSNGLIKIIPEPERSVDYSPMLMVTMIKAGKDTINKASLSHKQNNLSFSFAATSFLSEKQVMYSYRLQGGSNDQWSEPTNNATVSFIDLHPGDYRLDIKANFPANRYPEQIISYNFSIAPAWWQTWWFRSVIGLLIIVLLIIGFRFYYRRKLERQMALLEKQQAIEKERTRIATDMHDDLGAGLSRIKFLSQSILKKRGNDEVITAELEKITSFSDEMSEKMGEIIWALNEKNDTLADLIAYTRSYTVEYLANHGIKCEATTPLHLPGNFITGEMRRNIFLSVKECLHNIVKHAEATKVFFSIQVNGKMQVIIHDNGKGIDWNNQRAFSNGIANLKKRMKEINGSVTFSNEKGTKVSLAIPLNL
jgi:signal transduction histidine kinase/ligand-binding sensor domain-containing protein